MILKASELQIRRHIAGKLYQTRIELGIKQSDLEQEGIISQSRLSKIENGELNLPAITLYVLAKRYGKPLEYFFE